MEVPTKEVTEEGRRIQRLERESKAQRLTIAGLIVLGLVLATADSASTKDEPTVLRAKRFELQGDDGQVLAVIGTDLGKFPYLELNCAGAEGQGGRIRAEIPDGRGPSILLSDAERKDRLLLTMGAKLSSSKPDAAVRGISGQVPQLLMLDSTGRIQCYFGIQPKGQPIVELKNEDGKSLFKAPE